jgi:hypothetical protein
MPRKGLVTAITAAALLAVGYCVRQPVIPPAAAAPLRLLCGSERWPVKTFSDGDRFQVDLTRRYRTIKQLNELVRPPNRPQNGRVAGELSVYRVIGTVMTTINEDDGDVHLALLGDDGSTLIAEAPEPACSVDARDRAAINNARLVAQDVQPGEKVVAAGVGFFDFAHNQTGHATNYIELHPLLSLSRF